MEAAGQLAKAGCKVILIEKENETGGHIRNWYHLFPDRRDSKDVIQYLNKQIDNNNISLLKGDEIEYITKKGGVFTIDTVKGKQIRSDALLIATGFDLFKSERKEEYGYGIYDNVITSEDLETMFRKREILLTSGKNPRRVGFVHCVGSRDEKVGNRYCSKLCCVTAVKQAIEIKKHIKDVRVFCFYMDMRMGGALYEELYRESQEEYEINYIRGKVSEVGTTINKSLLVRVEDTLAGRPLKMELDMLVLMAGMEMSEGGIRLAEKLKLERGENRFFAPSDHHFGSNVSNIKGVFYAGTCTAPMNITDTISHARSAVAEIFDYLNSGKK